eukprot:6201647-Pleurochrysis_carterae.AAC.8
MFAVTAAQQQGLPASSMHARPGHWLAAGGNAAGDRKVRIDLKNFVYVLQKCASEMIKQFCTCASARANIPRGGLADFGDSTDCYKGIRTWQTSMSVHGCGLCTIQCTMRTLCAKEVQALSERSIERGEIHVTKYRKRCMSRKRKID